MTRIACDKRMSIGLNVVVYKTSSDQFPCIAVYIKAQIRFTRKNRDDNVKMDDRMENITTEEIRARAGVENISEKIREARLR